MPAVQCRVYCTFEFEALHQWDDAEGEVEFLKFPHRHIFQCRAEWKVDHHDREKEFIILKRRALAVVDMTKRNEDVSRWSCEQWAMYLLTRLEALKVEVAEDGENGAVVELCSA